MGKKWEKVLETREVKNYVTDMFDLQVRDVLNHDIEKYNIILWRALDATCCKFRFGTVC